MPDDRPRRLPARVVTAYEDFLTRVTEYRREYPNQREGQAHSNVWWIAHPMAPRPELHGPADPFGDDRKLPAFLEFVRTHLADWCPSCEQRVGTNRTAEGACATCGGELADAG